MNNSLNISDPYVRRARLQPALLVALPIALAALAYFPSGVVGWGILWSLLIASGGTALLSQVARDRGKRNEEELFQKWEGKPTTRRLRHRDATNIVLLNHQHARLKLLIPDLVIPTAEDEAANPDHADQVYDACVLSLRERTRDRKKFPLVFEENCSYGFRRNLWGMKPLGILTSALGSLAILVGLLFGEFCHLLVALDPHGRLGLGSPNVRGFGDPFYQVLVFLRQFRPLCLQFREPFFQFGQSFLQGVPILERDGNRCHQ